MSPPRRVGYVVKRYPRFSETFIVNELLAHEAAGLELAIFALRPPNDTHFQDGISRVRAPVSYLPHAGLKARELWEQLSLARNALPELPANLGAALDEDVVDVHQAVQLAIEANAQGLDHLHAHFASSATTVARLAARFAGISYSFTAHAKDIFHEEVDHADLRRKLDDASAVVTVSDFNRNHLRRSHPRAAARVLRIYNGLDLEAFRYGPPRDRPARIIAVGRLVEKKGFGDLVDACAILASTGRDFCCRIIGTGPLEAELRERIALHDLGERVLLMGPRPQPEVRSEISAAAVFAAPCVVGEDGNRDGLPTTLLESMALGTPCVATDVTGIPELVRDEVTGRVVPQHQPHALAAAIESLLDDRKLGTRLAESARRLIEAEFDVRRSCARLRQVFESCTRDATGIRRAAS